jgi:hydrogenase maturation protein HypF
MKIIIRGTVQGVGFRPLVYRIATSLGLRGYVMNRGADVEIYLDSGWERFLELLREELPPLASIKEVFVEETDEEKFDGFRILNSEEGTRLSSTPVDTAICKKCREELFDRNNRRYLYPFISCTSCGERFSVIENLPYDRVRTSYNDFPLCERCREEYEDPSNRRFHHQTISCHSCGPKYTLYDCEGKIISGGIEKFAELIDNGGVGIAKSWGGMHLVCNLSSESVKRARKIRRRENKPFAVMFRDIREIRKYADVDKEEEKTLLSPQSPIVLVKKKGLEEVSPGLDTIGVYLPYSGFHHILFHHLSSGGIIMTSANLPGEPMIIRNEDAFRLKADFYLLHDRKIVNRIDDSVLRIYKGRKLFLRRSRGWVPSHLDVPYSYKILALGAQENVCITMSKDGKLYPSQFIGDTSRYPTMEFLDSSIRHLLKILDLGMDGIDKVVVDLHPKYTTRRWGRKNFSEVMEVQHHWAHSAALLADCRKQEAVVLAMDGTGYGSDGTLWGGEILYASYRKFERIAHLEEIPLPGGETAIEDPRRILFAIFELLGKETNYFSRKEGDILRKLMKHSPLTSSMGRVLDALSCYLGICCRRTYDGEPAMKLEPYLAKGELSYDFSTERDGKKIRTLPLWEQLFDCRLRNHKDKCNAAYSFVHAILEEMSDVAREVADERGIEVGITGGVSYNVPILSMVEKFVKNLLIHSNFPPGDGGISIGQNLIGGAYAST